MLFTLVIILLELKCLKKYNDILIINKKYDIVIGILAGLCFTLKQTSGMFICIVALGNKLLFVKNKKEFIIYLKTFSLRLIGIVIPVVSMIIYLSINGAIYDFVSYTIKGISGFSNYISYKSLIKFNIVGLLAILVPISFIYFWYKCIIKEKDKITLLN